jgi:tetratricopeptide (TPR) repeat protein
MIANNIKNLFFSLLAGVLLISNNTIAQEILSKEENQQYSFTYQNNSNSKYFHSNQILLELSKSIPKRLEYTTFTVYYTQNIKINKQDSIHYQAIYELKNVYCEGDVLYRSFSVSDILIPALADFRINIYRKNNNSPGGLNSNNPGGNTAQGTLIQSNSFENVALKSNLGYYELLKMDFQDTIADLLYDFKIDNIAFYHNQDAVKTFRTRQNLIDIYYNSDPLMSDMLARLISFDFSDIDKLPYYDIKLREIEQELTELNTYNLSQNLSLAQNDPVNFINKYNEISAETHRKRTDINELLANLDQIFHQRGMDYLIMGKIDIAVEYFNKAIQVNQFYAPSHYQIAKLNYNNGEIDAAAETVTLALAKMNPDPNTHNLFVDLAKAIYNKYFSTGKALIAEKKFSEANETLERCKIFCTTTPGIFCEEDLEKAIAEAKYGIFQSYLNVVDKAIENDKLQMAQTYTEEARKYQQANSSYIISDVEISNAYQKIVNKYAKLATISNQALNYDNALEYTAEAEKICSAEEKVTCEEKIREQKVIALKGKYNQTISAAQNAYNNEKYTKAETYIHQAQNFRTINATYLDESILEKELMTKIQYEFYQEKIAIGKQKYAKEDFTTALNSFTDAEELSREYPFSTYDSLQYFIKASAKPIILSEIEEGNMKVWGNYLSEAREIYTIALQKQKQYYLDKDKEINTNLAELKSKIFDQECTNAQAEFDKFVEQARQKIQEISYIVANDYLDQAQQVSIQNTSCSISDQVVLDIKQRIRPAITYQKLLVEVNEDINRRSYASAHEKHNQAGIYYNEQNLINFNLTHINFEDKAIQTNDNNFIAYCCQSNINNKESRKAFKLLSLLCKRGYPKNSAREFQEKLGTQLAILDYEESPAGNYKLNIMKYTEGDKWFKYFKKKYKKTWKQISN